MLSSYQEDGMKILLIILIAILPLSCAKKEQVKEDPKAEEPKNGEEEGPAWSKFPMPKDDDE